MLNKKNKKIIFLLDFAYALHQCGTPSDQLENYMSLISKHLKLNGQFFSTPTYLMVSFHTQDDEFNHIKRVEPRDYDLSRSQNINRIGKNILKDKIDEYEGIEQIKDIMSSNHNLYHPALKVLAYCFLSFSIAFITDGTFINIAMAGFIGLFVGLIDLACMRFEQKNLFLILASFTVGLLSYVLHIFVPDLDPRLLILSGTIVLVPGFTLTLAISELANTHLASGTARLMSALVTLLKILFGIVFATKIVEYFSDINISSHHTYYSNLTKLLPLLIFSIGKSIFLNINKSDFKWVFLSSCCAFYVTRFGVESLGEEAGVFLGSLVTSLIAYQWANIYKRSPQVFLIPGIFLLVPGKMAYTSVSYFYEKNIISGINTGFNVFVISISIVIGLLVGNTLINTKDRFIIRKRA